MADVEFLLNVRSKGIEEITKNRKAINDLANESKKLKNATDGVTDSQEDLEKQTNDTRRSLDALGKAAEGGVSTWKKWGIGAVAAVSTVAVALKGITTQLGETLDAQSKLAQRIRFPIEDFQIYRRLAEDNAISMEEFADKVFDLSKNIEDASRGGGPLVEYFKELNINAKEWSRLAPEEQLRKFAELANSMDSNRRALLLDEAQVKELDLMLTNIEKIDGISKDLKERGLLFSQYEADQVSKSLDDWSNLVKDFETTLGKVVFAALPEMNKLLGDIKGDSSKAFDSGELRNYQNSLIVVTGLLRILYQGFLSIVTAGKLAIDMVANIGVFFGDFLVAALELGIVKLQQWASAVSAGFSILNEKVQGAKASVFESLGMEEAAETSRQALARTVAETDKHIDRLKNKMGEFAEAQIKFNKSQAANLEDFRNANQRAVGNAAAELKEQADIIKEAIGTIQNPDAVRIEAQGTADVNKFFDDIKRQAEQAAKNAFLTLDIQAGINLDKEDLKKQIEDSKNLFNLTGEEKYIKEIVNLYNEVIKLEKDQNEVVKVKLQLKQFEESIATDYLKVLTDIENSYKLTNNKDKYFKDTISAYETMIGLTTDNSEKMALQVKLLEFQKNAVNSLSDEFSHLNNLLTIGKITQEEFNTKTLETYKAIEAMATTEQTRIRIQAEQQRFKNQLLEKEKQLRDEINSKQAELYRVQGNELKALEIEEVARIERIKEQFGETSLFAEALELEKSLINEDKIKAQVQMIKDEIATIQEDLDNSYFGDFDKNAEMQERLIKLKERQIELEGKHREEIDKTSAFSLFTNAKVAELTNKGLDISANLLGNLITQTEDATTLIKRAAAEMITELSKVLLRQLIVNSFGSSTGGAASAFTSLVSSLTRNHIGTEEVTADNTSGRYGLKPNESLRVLQHGERVQSAAEAKRNNSISSNSSPTVIAKVIMDPREVAREVMRTQEAAESIREMNKNDGLYNN